MKIPRIFILTYRQVNSGTVNRRFVHERVWTCNMQTPSEASIRGQLEELSVPYKDGYTCLHLEYCSCCPNISSRNSDFFINKRTGFFLCGNCKATGDWASYSALLTKLKNEEVDVNLYKKYWERYDKDLSDWNTVVNNTEQLENLSSVNYTNFMKDFKLPFCSRTISKKLCIRINKEKNILFFPLQCYSSPVVGYKMYCKDGTESTFPKNDCPGFLLYSLSSKTDVVVVVAKITDFLALISQSPLGYDIICLQYGSSHIPQSTLPFFEKYSRIVLWLGGGNSDTIGLVAKKLVEKRCFVVRPVDNQVSAVDAFLNKKNVNEILSTAKLTWHQYVITFSSLRDEILAELQNNYEAAGVPWKRFPALTKILKGHRRGELTVVTGATGVGKTTFLSEYSLDLAMQGVNTLWGSFEIKNTRLAKIMLTQFAEAPLLENVDGFNAICDRFEELPLFFLTFHGQQQLSGVMDAIKHCSYTYDIAHVVIDNVQFMIEVSPDAAQIDRFWKQDFMIQSFRQFASNFNCHVTLVMHPKKTEGFNLSVNSIFGGVKASQEADNILIIQMKDQNTFGVKKYLQVSKNRYSGDLGLFPLYFDKQTLSFSKPINCNKSPTRQNDQGVLQPESWNVDEDEDSSQDKGY